MTFLWPEFLWGLAALPILVALYFVVLRKKQKTALRYASLALVRDSIGSGAKIRRHLPPFLFLIALGGMILAAARPTAIVTLPATHETVIMAMDVSGSMRATDVRPNRLA